MEYESTYVELSDEQLDLVVGGDGISTGNLPMVHENML